MYIHHRITNAAKKLQINNNYLNTHFNSRNNNNTFMERNDLMRKLLQENFEIQVFHSNNVENLTEDFIDKLKAYSLKHNIEYKDILKLAQEALNEEK